jgi:hypothetical protein
MLHGQTIIKRRRGIWPGGLRITNWKQRHNNRLQKLTMQRKSESCYEERRNGSHVKERHRISSGHRSLSSRLWNTWSAARQSWYRSPLFSKSTNSCPYSDNCVRPLSLPPPPQKRRLWNSFNSARKIGGIWRAVWRNRITDPPSCVLKTIDWRLASVANMEHTACLICLSQIRTLVWKCTWKLHYSSLDTFTDRSEWLSRIFFFFSVLWANVSWRLTAVSLQILKNLCFLTWCSWIRSP